MEINILNLVTLFIIYSFFGWILESVYKSICQRKWINSGFIYGPFCPIYGVGAIIMFIFLERYKDNLILLFFAGFIVLSVWEYLVGWFLEKAFNTTYWDYSNHKINIKGRVCLTNSIMWGILGIIFIHFIHPGITNLLSKIPQNITTVLTVIIGGYILIDAIITTIKVKGLEGQINKISEIGETLKEKLEQIKVEGQNNIENLQYKIDELKKQQAKLKTKVVRRTNRLKKAFPTMKSETISQFLNQKIELRREKNK